LSTTEHGVVSSNMHTCPQPGELSIIVLVLFYSKPLLHFMLK
jgi:hypothetical protein